MAEHNPPSIGQLVERCLAGKEQAWDALVEIITPVAFSVCRSMRLSHEESVDVFGQTCYLLLTRLENLRTADKVLSYVATTVRHEALKLIRRSRLLDDIKRRELVETEGSKGKNPEALLEKQQNEEMLIKAVFRLPAREAWLMWHLFFDENEPTYEEISLKLDMPVASIGPTRARCLAKLKKILARMGYDFLSIFVAL